MFTCPGASFSFDQSFPSITKFSSSSGFPSDSSTFCISGFNHLSDSYDGFTDSNPGPFSYSSSGSTSSPGSITRLCSCSGSITDSSSSYNATINARNPFTLIITGVSFNSYVGSLINNYGTNPSFITSLKPGFYADIDPRPNFSNSWWIVFISDAFFGSRELSGALSNSDIVIDSSIIPGISSRADTVFSIRSTTGSNSNTVSGSSASFGSKFSNRPSSNSHPDFGSSIIIICFTPGPNFSADTDFEPCFSSRAHSGSISHPDFSTGPSLNTGSNFPGVFPCFSIWCRFLTCHHGKPAICSQG